MTTLDQAAIAGIRALQRPGALDPLKRIGDLFCRSVAVELARLRAASAAGDADRIAAITHKIRSSSVSIGATDLGGMCLLLEEAAKAAGTQATVSPAAAAALDAEYERVVDALNQTISHADSGNE